MALIDAHTLWPGICQRLKPCFNQYYAENPTRGTLIFIDTETSGFRDADIIELGAISVGPATSEAMDVELDYFCKLIYPGPMARISPWATKVHGITDKILVRHGQPPIDVFKSFLHWTGTKSPQYFVAHNARFDRGMLENDLRKHGIICILPKFLCTLTMAKALPLSSRKLGAVASHFDYSNQRAHRSLTDAEVCAYIFAQMSLMGIKLIGP